MNGVREYIGMRYVPIFADPVEWDDTRAYESLTVVTYQGASYTSRRPIPAGIPITDGRYWALTGNYNAQVELYRQEVRAFDGRITQAQSDASDALTQVGTVAGDVSDLEGILTGYGEGDTVKGDVSALQSAITAVDTKVGTLPEGETSVVGYVDGKVQTINTALEGVGESITELEDSISELSNFHAVFVGDSFSTTTFVASADRWCYKIARALGVTPHIYAENGAGFAREGNSGHNFTELVQNAGSALADSAEKVKYVFVLGGLNDLQDTYYQTAFGTGARNFIDAAQSAFPNALVYVCGINSWSTGFSLCGSANYGNLWAEDTLSSTIGSYGEGVVHIPMAWALAFDSSLYAGTPPHPNASGHTAMAAWILNAMKGVGISKTLSGITLYDANNTEIGTMTLTFSPKVVGGAINLTSAAGTSGKVHDDFNILVEHNFIVLGTPLMISTGTLNGNLWSRTNEGVNYNGYGYGRITRVAG